LFFIRKYIRENILNWDLDSDNHLDKEIHEIEMTEIGGVTRNSPRDKKSL